MSKPDMRYEVKHMEKAEDYPDALAAVAYELQLRLEDYGVRGYPREDAIAVIHTLIRFGWRPGLVTPRSTGPKGNP
jgi:hypothetical protein